MLDIIKGYIRPRLNTCYSNERQRRFFLGHKRLWIIRDIVFKSGNVNCLCLKAITTRCSFILYALFSGRSKLKHCSKNLLLIQRQISFKRLSNYTLEHKIVLISIRCSKDSEIINFPIF